MITETMDTKQKIECTFACPDRHITTGTALLRAGKGYICPRRYCGKPVEDISDTKDGELYHAFARPDLTVKP